MGDILIVLTLLSILSSLTVLVSWVVSSLRAKCRPRDHASDLGQRLAGLVDWQQLQLRVCAVDTVLLLAVTPLFVIHTKSRSGTDSIWDTAFQTPTTTFAMTAALVLRPANFATLAAEAFLKHESRRWQVALHVTAAVLTAGISTISAARCSVIIHRPSTCAAEPFVRFIVIATQSVLAAVATSFLVLLSTSTSKARNGTKPALIHKRSSTVAPRAPSLSLLIHTQPDPWTRHIDLDSPIKTDFGPPLPNPPNIEYGLNFVRGILDDTAGTGRATDAATTSLGYNSAVASSTNPYHIGSAFSLASRDALNSLVASRVGLVAAGPAQNQRYATSTGKPSSAFLGQFSQGSLSSRTPSPALIDDASRPHSRLSHTATEVLLRGQRANSNSPDNSRIAQNKASSKPLEACLPSLWCPIALSSAALLLSASNMQACILLAAFCFPATVLFVQEFALGCSGRRRPSPQSRPAPQIRSQSIVQAVSPRASIASSAVIVYENPDSLRNRRPHLRSRSCPLESELNGYGDSLLGWQKHDAGTASKQRQSLSSARSVPYLSKHWTAGKISGDRVVAPRSSFVRGLNLMLNPKPKLEILPVQSSDQCYSVRSGTARDASVRQSLQPIAVTSAVVQGLLGAPRMQGRLTSDSEQTRIMQSYPLDGAHASSSMVSLSFPEADGESFDAASRHANQQREAVGDRSHDVILDMDVTPGSPRRQADLHINNEHSDLQSPTKRPIPASTPSHFTPEKIEAYPTASPSFSSNEDSQLINNSASRLFSEIMDMVRGHKGANPLSDQNGLSFSQSLRRSPPKGYASIDGEDGAKEGSVYDSVYEDGRTIVIHSMDSSGDFRSAASQGTAQILNTSQSLSIPEDLIQGSAVEGDRSFSKTNSTMVQEQAETGLVRKASTSSTLSLSSISSRIRSLRPTASGASGSPFASPGSSAKGNHHQVKKIRSRTFASAFGIELGMLSRSGSRSKRDTPGSYVESSPSTSAGTCPSSLMDLSFSPSPAARHQKTRLFSKHHDTPSPDGALDNSQSRQGVAKAHRRNVSRADSIMDMLDDEHGDTMEEMLDSMDAVSCANHVDECSSEGGDTWGTAETRDKMGRSDGRGEGLDVQAVEFDQVCEVDLADMTVNDVWQRSFGQDDERDGDGGLVPVQLGFGEGTCYGEADDDLMGFDPRRLVARAPFLNTVEEESEDESMAEAAEAGQPDSSQEHVGQVQKRPQEAIISVDARDTSSSSKSDSIPANCAKDEDAGRSGVSRESLLLEREAEQRRVGKLLMEHEAMFPHKTLSRIEEATEVATTLRTSGFRTISAASTSKLSGDKTAGTAEAGTIRLGLPLSLAWQGDAGYAESDTSGSTSMASADTVVADVDEDSHQGQVVEARLLPFVTPRSRMRRRAAAGRRALFDTSAVPDSNEDGAVGCPLPLSGEQAQVDPSPRSMNVRLGQLGMDQGIWMQSPVKLPLEAAAAGSAGGDVSRDSKDDSFSFSMADTTTGEGAARTTRMRRSLTFSKRLSTDSKATMRKLVRLDHHDSPKREMRDRLAKASNPSASPRRDGRAATNDGPTTSSSPREKRLLHKPIKKRRKSRIKGVAVMIARHHFTVVDEDDSLIQRFGGAQPSASDASTRPQQSTPTFPR